MKDVLRMTFGVGLVMVLVLAFGNIVNGIGHRKWQGAGRFTIIKVAEQIRIESIDPKSKLGVRLTLPADIEVNTLKARGQWRPKSLAILQGKYGWQWVGDSVADYLGIAYTGIWNRLGLWDKLAWWNMARTATWQDINLADTNLLVSGQSADNQKVLGVSDVWSEKARELFYASDLAENDVEIRVWNTTGEPGLAGKAAAVLESAGLSVIQVGEAETTSTRYCVVKSSKYQGRKKVSEWIAVTLGCQLVEDENLDSFVDIYLGTEYAKRYTIE